MGCAWYTPRWLGHSTGLANAVKGKPVEHRRGPRHCDRGQSSANPLGEEPGKGRAANDPASQETYCVRARCSPFWGVTVRLATPRGAEARRRLRTGMRGPRFFCRAPTRRSHATSWHSVVRAGGPKTAEQAQFMAKQHLVLGLILGGCIAAVACSSSDDSSPSNTGGSSGSSGKSGSGGTHAGGTTSGGTANGGSAGKAGSASAGSAGASEGGEGGAPSTEGGAGGEAGGGGFVIPLALDPWTVLVPSAAPATPNHLLVAGSDFTASTEITSITLRPAAVGDSTTYQDGDTVAVSSAGLGFALEETNDKVHLLDGGKLKTTFDVTDPGTDTAPLADNKAYVPVYNQSLISILDLSAGKVSRRLDLSQFNDASDSDGSADITAGAYDSSSHTPYFVLARIDRNAIAADPNFHLPCTTTRGLIVGIDTTTDAIVDLNGAADGTTLPLSLVGPSSLAINAAGTSLTLL